MRPAPTPRGMDRPAFECRVRFSGRLVGAVIGRVEEPPHPPAKSAIPAPAAKTTPEPPPSAPQPVAATPAPAAPADFWKTDLARELLADRTRIEEVLNHLRTAVADLRKDQADRLREWQRAAVELAMTMSARLLHERIEAGDFPVEAKVRDMIHQLEGESPAAVRLNPADLDLLKRRLAGSPLVESGDEPKLIADPALARGECRVEGKDAMLVSEVGRELQEIRDELLRSLAHARS